MTDSKVTPTPQAQSTQAAEVEGFHRTAMTISERKIVNGEGKNVFSKFLTYGLPTLDMVIDGAPAPDRFDEFKGVQGDESAIIITPVYDNAKLDYLQTALTQRVQGIARSRDKAGLEPATNWEELLESSSSIKYPVQLKEFKEGLAAYLETQDLEAKQIAAILIYTDTRRLQEADDHRKERVGHWFGKYVESLGDEAGNVASVVSSINRALEYNPEDIDF